MNELQEFLKRKKIKETIQLLLTEIEKKEGKDSVNWNIADNILSIIQTMENEENWKEEVSIQNFSWVDYKEHLQNKIFDLENYYRDYGSRLVDFIFFLFKNSCNSFITYYLYNQ